MLHQGGSNNVSGQLDDIFSKLNAVASTEGFQKPPIGNYEASVLWREEHELKNLDATDRQLAIEERRQEIEARKASQMEKQAKMESDRIQNERDRSNDRVLKNIIFLVCIFVFLAIIAVVLRLSVYIVAAVLDESVNISIEGYILSSVTTSVTLVLSFSIGKIIRHLFPEKSSSRM